MYSSSRENLIKGLCRISANLCSYLGKPCDCKFIKDDVEVCIGSESGSGCPETAIAAMIISNMTEQEFNAIAYRAGITVSQDFKEINVMETIKEFQKKKFNSPNPIKTSRNRKSAYQPGKLPKEAK